MSLKIVTALRQGHSCLSEHHLKDFPFFSSFFFLGGTVLEAPVENELGGLH